MSREIVIRAMGYKELAAICDCSVYILRKQLVVTVAKYKKDFAGLDLNRPGPKHLTKAQVKLFLQHNDVIPETITVN